MIVGLDDWKILAMECWGGGLDLPYVNLNPVIQRAPPEADADESP